MADRIMKPSDGVVWITGASSGIGLSTAYQMAAEGWTVAATARNESALNSLVADTTPLKGSVHAFAGDITDEARMVEIVASIEATHGPIALAILNAGIYERLDAPSFDTAIFARTIHINLNGTAFCLAPLIERMVARGQGHIALVSSVTGYGGLPMCAAYGATKAGLINLAQVLAIELAAWGVRVSVINPGYVDTPAQEGNDFPKPAMVSADKAASIIVAGLKKPGFELSFPKRFTWTLKALNMLPRGLYLALVRRATGWHKRKSPGPGQGQEGAG
ncbi:MAG: SDR family NAD(P)-dependent oxidoreductase [Pseudomonadota bacterium]